MNSLLPSIVTIVAHTPIWVWPLYALLLFLGFQRTRDSSLPLWRVLVLPLVVTLLAIISFIGSGLVALPPTLIGLITGGTVGWLLEREGTTRRLPDGRLWLRGEWWSFGQLLLVLVFRYATGVASGMDPVLNANPTWHFVLSLVSATLSALFLGRTAARLRVFRSAQREPA